MSETQVKITGTLRAVDDDGKEYNVTEYTTFARTTTSNQQDGVGEGIREYRLGNGTVINRISETEYELDDTRIHKLS